MVEGDNGYFIWDASNELPNPSELRVELVARELMTF
jgi:hypothetical protein